jgi:hypothetical protein
MNNTYSQPESRRIDIDGSSARSVELSVGDTVRCVRGQIWLTQEGDWRDYCLVAGVSFCADRKGQAVLSAIAGSSAVVVERRARAAVAGTVKIDSIEEITRGARRAQAEWFASVLSNAAAWSRARIHAALRRGSPARG